MKVKDMISALQNFDPETEVCIFDHKQNLHEDSGEGSSAGIHPKFQVELIEEAKPQFVALSFDNDIQP